MKHCKIQLDLKRMIGFRLVPVANREASYYAAKISDKVGGKIGAKTGRK